MCVHSLESTSFGEDLVQYVTDDKITASSIFYNINRYSPSKATLTKNGTWKANTTDPNQYIQVKFGGKRRITGVSTMGSGKSHENEWIKQYKVLYSTNGTEWTPAQRAYDNDTIFDGNKDQDSLVKHNFTCPLEATYVRIMPLTWKNGISMSFGVSGFDDDDYISFKEDLIDENAKLTASSTSLNVHRYSPHRARLTTVEDNEGNGGWTANSNDENPYIQVEFDGRKRITGVSTKGRHRSSSQWVTQYFVLYSTDGRNWTTVQDAEKNDKIFRGNSDSHSLVKHNFTCPFDATFVRIKPTQWNKHISMRFGISGCDHAGNLALKKPTNQSNTLNNEEYVYGSDLAVDGLRNTCSSARGDGSKTWWSVDLQEEFRIQRVRILNITAAATTTIQICENSNCQLCGNYSTESMEKDVEVECSPSISGRQVQILNWFTNGTRLCEVEVFGLPSI
ncbi:hypothetical protein ScPMuIL_018399 [Solemya velum]